MNLDNCRLPEPLQEVGSFESDERKPVCSMCGDRFCVGESLGWKGIGGVARAEYGLCMRHYVSAYYAADPAGLGAVEAELGSRIPPLYSGAEFNTFKVSGACGEHLAAVRQTVAEWAESAAREWWFPAVAGQAGNVYLYADRSGGHTGNGCGKTHLAWSAFKYVARRTAAGRRSGDPTEAPVLTCAFIDIQEVAAGFRKRQEDGAGGPVWYNFDQWNGDRKSGTFNEYLANLAEAPVLFVDDIGNGRYTDRNGNPGLAATAFETIADARASRRLPTLYTSNCGPQELGDRVGSRAASRIFRSDCRTLCVRAPDYAMSRSVLSSPPRFKMGRALEKV